MKIDIDGMARQLQEQINRIVATADRTDLYMAIGETLRSYMMEEQFATLGKYLNKQEWAGLSAGYKKQKKAKTGRDKADLVGFGSGSAGRLATSFNYRIKNGGIVLSNDAPYSVHLQYGTKYMPARPIIPDNLIIPDDVMSEIEFHVKAWVIDNIKNL